LPTVHIQGDSRVWELTLAFVYAGTTYLTHDTILPVMQLAREYHLDGLYDYCMVRLERFVSNAVIEELKRYAAAVGDERIEAKCTELASRKIELDKDGIDASKLSFSNRRKFLSKHFRRRS
jgi:hypothetical protein